MINQPKYWDGAKPGLILLLIAIKFYQFAKIMIFFRIKLKLYMIQWNFWESNSNIYDIQCHYKKNWILFSFVCYYYLYVINTFVKWWNLLIFCRTDKSLFGQVNFQTLSDWLSCKVWETSVKTGLAHNNCKCRDIFPRTVSYKFTISVYYHCPEWTGAVHVNACKRPSTCEQVRYMWTGPSTDFSHSMAYVWSLPIWRKPPNMAPSFTPSRRDSKNPDIYEFRFFAFAKS